VVSSIYSRQPFMCVYIGAGLESLESGSFNGALLLRGWCGGGGIK
jgi:hypothetical protein